MKDRISTILERWFIQEPALFQIICTHKIQENTKMECIVRSGRRVVEYNPGYVAQMSDEGLDEALRTEAVRILLKHPYERRPDGCSQQAIAMGSNVSIGDNYKYGSFNIETPADFDLAPGMPYEWYSRKIQEMLGESEGQGDADISSTNGSAGKYNSIAELWDEDAMTVTMIDKVIENCAGSNSWGTLAGKFAEMLKASTRAKINWHNVLSGFRASILSSKRCLTRMRPNRRYCFDQMGSKRQYDTRLLVAVDVSGSISSKSLSYFYGIINNVFRYGIETVDVIQFDCGVRYLQSLKKAVKEVKVTGRGGTSFQEPVDYAHENNYDGLLILTDGYAPQPAIPDGMRCKIIWVCQNKASYEENHSWMEKSGRVCTIELD